MITASLEGKHLKITAGPRDTPRLQQIPGARANPREGYWTVPATLYQAVLLRNLFGEDFTYGEDVEAWALAEREREQALSNPSPVDTNNDLFEFQKRGVARLSLGSCILADETGVGKTPQALAALSATQAFPALVVATKSMTRKWAKEAERWCPEAVPYVVAGPAKKRLEVLEAASQDPSALVIIGWSLLYRHSRLAGYGSVPLTEEEARDKELNRIPFRTVIADEAHRAVIAKNKQTRALWWLADRAEYVYPLTATPYSNNYADLWGLLRLVTPDAFPTKGKYLDRYVQMIERPWGRESIGLRQETKAELFWWTDFNLLRRTPEEVPELAAIPKVREIRVDLELSGKQGTAYKKFHKNGMATFDDNVLTATEPLTKLSRLRYLASATPVVDENGEVTALTMPSNKVDAMLELFEDDALPAVVFAESRKLIELACEQAARKYRVAKITGSENERQREIIVDDFQAGRLDAVFCTAAGGEGITLSRGKSSIFLQDPASLVQYRQMKGRVPRIGSERDVVMEYHLISEDTVDEDMYQIVVTKTLRMEEVVRDSERLGKLSG